MDVHNVNQEVIVILGTNCFTKPTLTYYKVHFLLKSGQSLSKIILFYNNYYPDWFLNLRKELNHIDLYNNKVVLIECIRKLSKEEIKKINMATKELSLKMSLIKRLKDATNGKISHCKNAIETILEANKGAVSETEVLEKAMVIMNEKKQVIAATKSFNKTNFFAIFFEGNLVKDSNTAILLKFGCESEQGVKMLKDKYAEVLQKITEIALKIQAESVMDVLGAEWDSITSVSMKIKEISGALSEKVELDSVEFAESVPGTNNTFVDHYIHQTPSGDKGAAILIYNYKKEHPVDSMRKILHQTVATCPLHQKENEILNAIVEETTIDIRESIAKDNARFDEIVAKKINLEKAEKLGDALQTELKEITEELKSGKTKKIHEKGFEKAIEGKINKFKKEICLESQDYMFCDEEEIEKQTISKYLEKLGVTIFDMVVI